MGNPQICMGCFTEWDEEWESCRCCGWTPDREPETDEGGWHSGQVLEKRYLLGKLYLRRTDYVIWRCYDSALEVKCFLLVSVGGRIDIIPKLAWGFAGDGEEGGPVSLALKEMDHRYALIFSLPDPNMPVKEFLRWIKPRRQPEKCIEELVLEETPENALPADTILAKRYRILGPVGIGGFGVTYLCYDIMLQRNVAVKEYFPAEWSEREDGYVEVRSSKMLEAHRYGMEMFCREAKMTAKFIHTAHLPVVYDILEENDTRYMVMDYIEGISVGKEMRERDYRPYSPEEMAEIVMPVLEGLSALHDRRIIHSDISPGNILRTGQGDIVLIDLGAAKYDMERQPGLSAAFLKQDYAAPEQYRTAMEGTPVGEGPWTDIYAVGATMYYLLTGHKPTDALTRLSGKTTELVPPKKYRVKLKKEWMKLIHRCMELQPERRIHSCQEIEMELAAFL